MMISQHSHWRTVEEWSDLNVPLSTPSNEASKMFDATMTQVYSYYNDPTVGGVATSIKTMLEADPNFVMGHCTALDLQMVGCAQTARTSPELKASVETLVKLAEKQTNLSPSEKKHVQAVKLFSEGKLKEACVTWEDILLDHPHDLLALHLAYLGYILVGDSAQLRDTVARVLPRWNSSTPLYGYLIGMHGFGLEETNMFDRAEKQVTKALEINPYDAWATHSMSHICEMTGQQDRGIKFLDSTVNNWQGCGMLACHNWWHCALHHIEKGEYEQALEIFDNQVKTRCIEQKQMFNASDASSLLFRLEMEGVNVADRWREIQEVAEQFQDVQASAFYDAHIMMACLGSGNQKAVQRLLDSLEQFLKDGQGTTWDVYGKVGVKLCKALVAYKEGDFTQAVELVYPMRYQLFTIGGSNAQRDVFNLFLITAAIQSSKPEHHRLARTLLAERKAFKENSPLTDRLMARVLAAHSS